MAFPADDLAAAYSSQGTDPTGGVLPDNCWRPLARALAPRLEEPLEDDLAAGRVAFASPGTLTYARTAAQAAAEAGAGKTVVLQSLQQRPGLLQDVAAELQHRNGLRVVCSAYISRAGARSFEMHTDAWDALVVLLAGSKEFVYLASSGARQTVLLQEGGWLLLPEGVRHRALTATGSLHISFNFIRGVGPRPQWQPRA